MAGLFTEEQVRLRRDLLLGIERERQMPCVPPHSHEFIELAFVAAGSALHRHTGRDGQTRMDGLIQGDLFSVQTGEVHGYDHCGSMVLYNVFLKPALLERYRELREMPGWKCLFGDRAGVSGKLIHFTPATRVQIVQCLDALLREYRQNPRGAETMIPALFTEFLVTAVRTAADARGRFRELSPGILESISRMEGSPEQHFTLRRLAELSCMCVASYTRKFRAATGLSPMEYLLNVRLRLVRHYLLSSDLSIGEIAAKCGFCSANYLIKLFRRETDTTPSQYRRMALEKSDK